MTDDQIVATVTRWKTSGMAVDDLWRAAAAQFATSPSWQAIQLALDAYVGPPSWKRG